MIGRMLMAALLAASGVGASACELNELFGLQLTKAVPRELVLKRFEEDNAGIVRFSFKPRAEHATLAPLQAHATGRRYFLTSISGAFYGRSAEEARTFLAKIVADLNEKHRCRFKADRSWIDAVADVASRDVEAHVSIGSAAVAGLQRDGARVVLKLRTLDLITVIAKDPPE